MYQNFLDQFTDFVFVEHAPAASDIIFIPGNGYPQMAERAAARTTLREREYHEGTTT